MFTTLGKYLILDFGLYNVDVNFSFPSFDNFPLQYTSAKKIALK